MRIDARGIGLLLVAVAVAGCGGSLGGQMTGQGGQGGATTTIPCSAMGACECLNASDRCRPLTEDCWCPGECYPGGAIDCICGGGRFLACEDSAPVIACGHELRSVQAKCANQSFVQYIGDVCTTRGDPTCVAACLGKLLTTGSCSEIDCRFCPVCDCAVPTVPSPFADCIQACVPPPVPEQN